MSDNVYSYAVIIGIDGMGGFNKEAATPFMDEITEMIRSLVQN